MNTHPLLFSFSACFWNHCLRFEIILSNRKRSFKAFDWQSDLKWFSNISCICRLPKNYCPCDGNVNPTSLYTTSIMCDPKCHWFSILKHSFGKNLTFILIVNCQTMNDKDQKHFERKPLSCQAMIDMD